MYNKQFNIRNRLLNLLILLHTYIHDSASSLESLILINRYIECSTIHQACQHLFNFIIVYFQYLERECDFFSQRLKNQLCGWYV